MTSYSTANDTFHVYMLTHASVDACAAVRADRLSYEFYGPAEQNFAEVATFSWRDGESEGTVWVAWAGTKLRVLGVTGATDPPGPVAERVAETLGRRPVRRMNNPTGEGSPAKPNTGRLVLADHHDRFRSVVSGLDRPTTFEIIKETAYVITINGKVLRITGLGR